MPRSDPSTGRRRTEMVIGNGHRQDETLQIVRVETLTEDGDEKGNGDLTAAGPEILEPLAGSDTGHAQSETSHQKITKGIMEATHELDQKLSHEGEDTLEKAVQLVSETELKHLEAQRELESAEIIRAEADAYFEEVIKKARLQVEQNLTIKTAAVTYQEKLLKAIERGSSAGSTRTGQGGKFSGVMPIASRLSLKHSNKHRSDGPASGVPVAAGSVARKKGGVGRKKKK